MTTEISLPVAVAYFTVRVPARETMTSHEARTTYKEDARQVVEAYLYSGSGVVNVDLDNDDFDRLAYVLTVRTENWKSVDDLTGQVQYQRDRLSSGLYSSTEPKILYAPVVSA